jgi:chromosome segregation protein
LSAGGERVEPVAPVRVRIDSLMDEETIRERVQTVENNRVRLAALGEVNLAAIQEYEELSVRYGELAAQRADLDASVEGIRSAIAKLNRECRQRFRDAFDRVNECFQASYPRLVGGGSARLELTNEEDLLETGVEICVQPPGKRLQNLSLLSGGEKAMAAIALLLSLFQVKPSPFCLLDEVDAPLDEANGARFNEMLKEMQGISQFIVITHNRKTMEAADTLYGITMATPGVSRLVSVRLGVS